MCLTNDTSSRKIIIKAAHFSRSFCSSFLRGLYPFIGQVKLSNVMPLIERAAPPPGLTVRILSRIPSLVAVYSVAWIILLLPAPAGPTICIHSCFGEGSTTATEASLFNCRTRCVSNKDVVGVAYPRHCSSSCPNSSDISRMDEPTPAAASAAVGKRNSAGCTGNVSRLYSSQVSGNNSHCMPRAGIGPTAAWIDGATFVGSKDQALFFLSDIGNVL